MLLAGALALSVSANIYMAYKLRKQNKDSKEVSEPTIIKMKSSGKKRSMSESEKAEVLNSLKFAYTERKRRITVAIKFLQFLKKDKEARSMIKESIKLKISRWALKMGIPDLLLRIVGKQQQRSLDKKFKQFLKS